MQPAPTEIVYERPQLYPLQEAAIFCPERYAVIEASTKSGKTHGCLAWLWEQAAINGQPGWNYWWVAPVYSQAEIAYRRLKRAAPRELIKANDSKLYIALANGTVIWFKSGEKPDNLYGEDVHGCVIDEASRVRADAWHALRSTITATRAPVRIIGNVKGMWNWFYELARKAEKGDQDDTSYSRLTWRDAVTGGVLDSAEIDDAKAHLPSHVFRELYEAEAAELAGRVYKQFTKANIAPVEDTGGDILVGMDFDVSPMSAVIASRAGDELHVWDEVELDNSNTDEMCAHLRDRYGNGNGASGNGDQPEKRDIHVYPDPAGRQRRSSAPVGQTDFTVLRSYGFEVSAPKAAPPVVDRVNETNAMFQTADGRRRCYINPRCASLIQCLERVTYKEGTSIVDKSQGLEHLPDALGYLIGSEYPLRGDNTLTLRILRI
jgi:hypothetical protein